MLPSHHSSQSAVLKAEENVDQHYRFRVNKQGQYKMTGVVML